MIELARYLRDEVPLADTVAAFAGDEDRLWPAWQAVVAAAVAGGDTDRDRLVALLVALGESGRAWFGAVLRESWDVYCPPEGSAADWARLNDFAARLTAAGIDFLTYAVWTLRDALESTGTVPPDLRPAVAPWFEHCGRMLHDACAAGEQRPYTAVGAFAAREGVPGPGFSVARWDFWQRRRA
ncbi:DUF3632 domain-containing protein [Actinoplanes sp. RD1]|uniref:DUF3632 domain-containing protein n=1 Tax=Actinoplanes sp. RD1 TaxID=3064538 RepID=UPI0027414749|nr:DUF3632 domain-containing protein [Actinoplanes sp. RD1]